MKLVYKYPVLNITKQYISLPKGAQILTIQMQYDAPQLWALVEPSAPEEKRPILIVGTGHALNEPVGRYISTFQMAEGRLVFHCFEGAAE